MPNNNIVPYENFVRDRLLLAKEIKEKIRSFEQAHRVLVSSVKVEHQGLLGGGIDNCSHVYIFSGEPTDDPTHQTFYHSRND